jgi:hypothetical protein
MIILVTGSRWWHEWKQVDSMIDHYWALAGNYGEELIVRHGDCPSGADHIAQCIVYKMQQLGIQGISEDPMPAKWQHRGCRHPKGRRNDGQWYCRAAGPLRNQAMIDKGDIFEVHAYPLPGGTGTADCVARAVKAGLVVTNHGHPKVTMEDMLSVKTVLPV